MSIVDQVSPRLDSVCDDRAEPPGEVVLAVGCKMYEKEGEFTMRLQPGKVR